MGQRKVNAPSLTLVFNNACYSASRTPLRGLYPNGAAVRTSNYMATDIQPPPDYAMVAESCGALGITLREPTRLSSNALGAYGLVADPSGDDFDGRVWGRRPREGRRVGSGRRDGAPDVRTRQTVYDHSADMTWFQVTGSVPTFTTNVATRARELLLRHKIGQRVRLAAGLGCQSTNYAGATIRYPVESRIGREIASGHGWDVHLFQMLRLLLPDSPSTILEVGSNIGASVQHMISACPDGRFYCFEPSTLFRHFLNQNLRANGWKSVVVVPLALSDHNGVVRLHTNESTASVVAQEYDWHSYRFTETIRCVTIDEYFRDGPSLDFIKIDTDGYDYDVLLGATRNLERDHPFVYFEFSPALLERAGRSSTSLLDHLKSLNYANFIAFSDLGSMLAQSSDVDRVLELTSKHPYLDILAVPADRPGALARAEVLFETGHVVGG